MYVKKTRGKSSRTFSPVRGGSSPRRLQKLPRRLSSWRQKGGRWVAAWVLILGGAFFMWGLGSPYIWEKVKVQIIQITAHHGLVIDDIMIEGRFHADVEDVKNAVGVDRGDPIFLYSPAFIKQRLETLPWIRSAFVQRIIPNIIYIRLVERRPIAIWQNRGKHFLIDKEGKIIDSDKIGLFKDLPLVVGAGAPEAAQELLANLESHPQLKSQLKAGIRVGERRWDFHFKNGVKVLFPETGLGAALTDFVKLEKQYGLLQRDVKTIDMRFPDRVIFSLSESLAAGIRSRGKGRVKRV